MTHILTYVGLISAIKNEMMIHLSEYHTSGEIQYIYPSYVEFQLDPNGSALVDCPQHIQRNQLQATYKSKP